MTGTVVPGMEGVRVFPPPPKGFDGLTATKTDLARHGIPPRPDPRTQPERAALWEQCARRYGGFEHLEPQLIPADTPTTPAPAEQRVVGLTPLIHCGYMLFSEPAFTQLSATWTVPNLNHTPGPHPGPIPFRTFFGLGSLDVHVEMTVDAAQNVTSVITIHTGAQVALPVSPGDAISALLCLNTDPPGTAAYFLANETTSQTVNFTIDTGFFAAHVSTRGSAEMRQLPQSAGSIWRGVLRRDRRLHDRGNAIAYRRRSVHDGRHRGFHTGETSQTLRERIQDNLRRRLKPYVELFLR